MEAQAARSLAETSYQDQRFSLPPGFLSGPAGSKGSAPCLGPAVLTYDLLHIRFEPHLQCQILLCMAVVLAASEYAIPHSCLYVPPLGACSVSTLPLGFV